MVMTKLIITYALFFLNIFSAFSYDSENLKSNLNYYSSIINSGLVKFIDYGYQLLQSDGETRSLEIRKLSSIYSEVEASRSGVNDDELNIQIKKNIIHSAPSYSNELVHIPKESKVIPLSYRLKMKYEGFDLGDDIQYHFPRIKYLKKVLPSITVEPYQRIMSFSIEVCMVPSIWYLELIHCMYMGMARHYTGIIMSYSLQDIVGSAIMSIGYKDESFSVENCYYSVSLVADNQISNNYIKICERMEKCLKSKPLTEGPFSEFKTEFEERIKRVYSFLKWKNGDLSPVQFARYSLLYSLYFVKNRINLQLFYPERNFLPIRIMLSSLGIYCISGLKNDSPKKYEIVETLAKLISKGIMLPLESFNINCPLELLPLFKSDSYIITEFFCKEIFSIGFINENIVPNKVNNFITVTKPSRVLISSYHSVIPRMKRNLRVDKYNTDWMNFIGTEEVEPNQETEEMDKKRIFKSKVLKYTRKMNSNGVRNRFDACGTSGKKSKKLSKRITFLFNKSRKKSHVIVNHISGL